MKYIIFWSLAFFSNTLVTMEVTKYKLEDAQTLQARFCNQESKLIKHFAANSDLIKLLAGQEKSMPDVVADVERVIPNYIQKYAARLCTFLRLSLDTEKPTIIEQLLKEYPAASEEFKKYIDSKPAVERVKYKIADAETLKKRFRQKPPFDHVITSSDLVSELAGEEREALSMVATLELIMQTYISNLNGPMGAGMTLFFDQKKSTMIHMLLQDYPAALQELEKEGVYDPSKI